MAVFNEFGFRRFQVVHDLKCVSGAAQGAGYARIATAVPGESLSPGYLQATLVTLQSGDGRIPPGISDDLLPCLMLAAAQPEPDRAAFLAATAFLLADRIRGGSGADNLDWYWDAFASHYRAADSAAKAALMKGFLLCRDMGLVTLDSPPRGGDLVTGDVTRIRRDLLALARQMTPDDMTSVSRADRGYDAERHLAALTEVLGPRDGLYPPGEVWFPAEVVEMTAHAPERPGFLACLALVCLNALEDGDSSENMASLWSGIGHILAHQSDGPARPVLAGLRHLFESVPGWSAYRAGWSENRIARQAIAIPWLRSPA